VAALVYLISKDIHFFESEIYWVSLSKVEIIACMLWIELEDVEVGELAEDLRTQVDLGWVVNWEEGKVHDKLEGVYKAPQVLEGWCTIEDKADLV
jgi:hypothetical protein